MMKTAIISDCGLYRYRLARAWDGADKVARFIMLNPSTADADNDDPTIRRCIGFAKREGCGALAVVNMFAYRATEPATLLCVSDPVGPKNDETLRQFVAAGVKNGDPIIAAWGATADCVGLRHHIKRVERIVREAHGEMNLFCLGVTQAGNPRHPLYVPADQPLVPYQWSRS